MVKGSWKKKGSGSVATPGLPFMFEVTDPVANKPWQMLLPVNPENYKMTYQPRVSSTTTQGGVFEDNIGLTPPKFSISGVFGVMGTFNPSAPQKSLTEHKNMLGLDLYQELEKNLLSFYEQFGTYDMGGGNITKADTKELPKLNFYNFYDEEYWVVQINQFNLVRNTQRRHLYQYDIQMTGLQRVSEDKDKVDASFTNAAQGNITKKTKAELDALAASASTWSKLLGEYKSTMQGIQKIQSLVGDLQSPMTAISTAVANFTNGVTSLVHAPLDLVKSALATVNSIMASAKNLANLPHEFINDMRQMQRLLQGMVKQPQMFVAPPTASRTSTTTRAALGKTADATTSTTTPSASTTTQVPTGREILAGPVTPAMRLAGATGMLIPEETIYDGEIEEPMLVAAKQELVLGNDTIQTIAARTGTGWQQIASLNNLDYPFISSNPMDALSPAIASGIAPEIAEASSEFRIEGLAPAPGNILAFDSGNITLVVKSYDGWSITVTTSAPAGIPEGDTVTVHEKQMSIAVPGQKLSIPGSSPAIGQIAGSSETFDELLFGIDEMLDNNGEMPDYGTDIVVAAGAKNLAMQIYHRINTLKGELAQLGHPEYGSLVPTFIGKPMTPVWQERILLECRLAAEADPRVQYLDNVRLYNEDTALYFEADVYPINNQDPVVVSIPIA
jgi:phage baseplate assembly protein W